MVGKSLRMAAVTLVLVFASAFSAQTRTPIQPAGAAPAKPSLPLAQVPDPQFNQRRNQEDPIEIRMERERQKALQKERFESLKKDTEKLLKLATELKESVDKATKDTLSLEVIRKTEEVEKLAKQVRQKMKAQ